MRKHTFAMLVLTLTTTIFNAVVCAQVYPSKTTRIMVGAAPGGGTDVIARMLAEKFAESMQQTFVVDNRPGASNTIAAEIAARAVPDGHTVLLATNTGQAIAPHLLKLGFDTLRDLHPIGLITAVPHVLLVSSQETARDVRELVSRIKAKPGSYNYASVGIGSTQHIAAELFNSAAGTSAAHIPYKGSSAALIDLIAGQVQILLDTTSSAMPHIKSGKLRVLAITSARRSAELPLVATMAELGYPGVEMSTWYGMYVTAGVSKPVIDKLNTELQRALKLSDVQERLRGLGGEQNSLTLEQFVEMNRNEFERYGKLIRAANIRAD